MAKEQKAGRTAATTETSVVVNNIRVAQLQRGNQSVQTWFSNLKSAESTINPNRKQLYQTYLDVAVDLHVDSVMDKRIRAVKTTPFEWVGLENDVVIKNFKSPWFSELLSLIQSRIFYGTTLAEFQLGQDGLINDVLLVPRQNVKPEKGIISLDGNSDSGILYKEGQYLNYILQIGRDNDLGKLAKIAPYVLMKRVNLADFTRYNEMFGMPLRVYEYDPLKPGAREEVEKQAEEYGSAAYIVLPKGSATVEFHDSVKQSTAYAYDKLHQILNDEITIGVLGQLLTTGGEGGGSYALGNIHKAVETGINLEDRLTAEYIINYPFKNNILIPHGYPINDFEGRFKTSEEINKEAKLKLWIELYKSGAPIAEEDFYKEFGIEPPGSRPVVAHSSNAVPDPASTDPKPEPPPEKKKQSKLSAELATFYGHKCSHDKSPMRVTLGYKSELNAIIDSIIQKLKSGELKAGDVDPKLYNLTAEELWLGVQKGIGVKLEAASGTEYAMLKALRTNVYVFSGFKTFQFLKQASELLVDADGKVKAFSTFRDEVLALNSQYNIEYLRTEYNYAIASSRMAGKWQQFEANKGTLPLLQYETVGDARVRAAHAALDGIIKPVGDDFWNQYLPPNSWNCRCTVRQLAEGTVSETKPENLPQLTEMFKTNTGKSQVIFPPSHPYYNVDAGDQKNADNNFGLPLPE